jgi:hypothetical protein
MVAVLETRLRQRIDLLERQRHLWSPFEIAAEYAIARHAEIEGGLGRLFNHPGAMFLGQRQHAEDATDTSWPVVPVDVITDGADRRPDAHGRFEERHRFRRRAARTCSRRSCPVFGSSRRTKRSSTTRRRAGRCSPVGCRSTPPRPPRGHRGVRCGRRAVVAKRLERQRAERGPLLGKHGRDLALRGAVRIES